MGQAQVNLEVVVEVVVVICVTAVVDQMILYFIEWVAGSSENETISTQVKVVAEVGVELGNNPSQWSN